MLAQENASMYLQCGRGVPRAWIFKHHLSLPLQRASYSKQHRLSMSNKRPSYNVPYHHNTVKAPATKQHPKAINPPTPDRVSCQLTTPLVGPPAVFVPISADQALIPSTVPTAGELGGDGVLYVGVKISCRTVVSPKALTVVYVYSVTPCPTGTVGAGWATGPCSVAWGVKVVIGEL